VLGVFFSQDPRAIRQVPDLSRQAVSEQNGYSSVGRLTWQATPRNKFTGFVVNGLQHYPTWLAGLIGPLTITPEGTVNLNFDTWTSTVTSRLLLDAGVSLAPLHLDWPGQSYAANDIPGILDAATLSVERNLAAFSTWQATKRQSQNTPDSYRGSAAYVTGSHAFKTGFLYTTAVLNDFRDFHSELGALPMSYLTFSGTPLQVTYYDTPHTKQYAYHNLGIYGQDQWRRDRLTVNAGVRFDYLQDYNPAQGGPPTIFAPVAKSYPEQDVVGWKDLSPRLGVAYDLFSNGKTALKASANRYVLRASNGECAGHQSPGDQPRQPSRLDGPQRQFLPRRRSVEPACQRRAGAEHESGLREPAHQHVLRPGLGVRVSSAAGGLGILDERPTGAAPGPVSQRRVFPARLHQPRAAV
jgi:hypothetical protein